MKGWDGDNSGHASRVLEGYLGFLNAGPKFGEIAGMILFINMNTVLIGVEKEIVNETRSASVVLSPAVCLLFQNIFRRRLIRILSVKARRSPLTFHIPPVRAVVCCPPSIELIPQYVFDAFLVSCTFICET